MRSRGIEYAAHLPIRSGTQPDKALHRERISPNGLTGGSRFKRADDELGFRSKRWEGETRRHHDTGDIPRTGGFIGERAMPFFSTLALKTIRAWPV